MRWVPVALLVLANAVWGSSYVVAKVALEEIPPPLLAALRFSLAAAALWLILLLRRARDERWLQPPQPPPNAEPPGVPPLMPQLNPTGTQPQPPNAEPPPPLLPQSPPPPPRAKPLRSQPLPSRSDATRLLALGAVGITLNGLLGYWGVSLTTATDAALLIVGEVLFTSALAVLLASERINQVRAIGLLVGVLGVVILIQGGATAPPTAEAPSRALGDILILLGLAFESAFTVLGTRLTRRYEPLTVLTVSMSGSCILWLPVIAWYLTAGASWPSVEAGAGVFYPLAAGLRWPSMAAGAGVLYLALVNSVVCYLVWFAVLRQAGAGLGALSLLAQPVVGALLGIVVLGDPLTPSTLLGGACVAVCLVLASLRQERPLPRTTAEP